jgi:Concanavalin A-like lectin/glucanases superfamily
LNVHAVLGKNRSGTGRSQATRRSATGTGVLGLLLALLALAAARDAAAAGVIARWPLDEGSGQVATDVSGHGHHARLGRLSEVDGNDPAWVPGRFGSALRFIGDQSQFAEIAEPATLTPGSITVEAWVRRLGTPGQWRYVLSNGGQACDFSSFGLYSGADGGLAFYVSDRHRYVSSPVAAPGDVWDGGWHHAAGTYDGQRVRLYLDGAEVGTGSPTALAIFYGLASPGAFIGTYRGECEQPFTGDLDEVAVRDGALGAAEIAALAAEAAQRPAPPQVPPVTGGPAGGGEAPPQVPPVTGGPAGGGEAPPPQSAPVPSDCFSIRVIPGRVVARRRTRLRIEVRRRGRAARGVRVTVGGLGVHASARTMQRGRAQLVVRSLRRGRLRVIVRGQPSGCAVHLPAVRWRPGG